jgi:hypothetical protein
MSHALRGAVGDRSSVRRRRIPRRPNAMQAGSWAEPLSAMSMSTGLLGSHGLAVPSTSGTSAASFEESSIRRPLPVGPDPVGLDAAQP